MKKRATFTKLAVALFMGATAVTANAAVTLAEMPVNGTDFKVGLVNGSGTLYYYAPATDGTLTITCTQGGSSEFLFDNYNASAEECQGSALNGTGDLATGLAFEVYAGDTYYAYEYAFNSFAQRTMTATFTPAAGGGDVTPSGFQLEEAEWKMGQTYQGFTWKTEAEISGPSNLYVFEPDTDGTLVVTQNGADASMGHIYTKEWNKKSNFSTYSNVMQTVNGYYDQPSSSQYVFTYDVFAGGKYYFYAKNENADPMTSMSATFTSKGVSNKNVAQVGIAFDCYKANWEFTPEVTGVMYVTINPYDFSIADPNGGSNLVYADAGHGSKVACNGMGEDVDAGYQMTYNVKEGVTYYFYQDARSGVNVTIDKVEAQEISVALVNTDPEPGNADWNIDPYSYVSGFRYYFAPATNNVTIESATIEYNDINNNPQKVELTGNAIEYQGGGFSLRIYETLVEMKANGKPGEMFHVTLNGIKLDGETVPVISKINSQFVYTPGEGSAVPEGSIQIDYYLAPELKLNSEKWPTTIYEKYVEGDANGKAYMVFSNAIETLNEATITLGNHTWGAVGGEAVDPTASIPYQILEGGTTLEFDFTDLQWENPEGKDMASYSTCTIFVTGIQDQYGQIYGDNPSVDKKITFSAEEAENPVIAMPLGQVISPSDNKYATNLEYFMVQWTDQELSRVMSEQLVATLYIDDVEYNDVPVEICPINEESEVNDCLKIDLSDYEGMYGTFTAIIPMGIVQNAVGNVNPYTTISCYILPENENYTVTPDNGEVEQGGVIEVAFEGTMLTINDSAPSVTWANNTARWRTNGANAIVIDVYEDMEPGEYELIIPATVVIIDGTSLNCEVNETFVVIEADSSAINGINSDANGNYTVFNMAGVKVASGKADVVKSLARGMYIINGKKVIVK